MAEQGFPDLGEQERLREQAGMEDPDPETIRDSIPEEPEEAHEQLRSRQVEQREEGLTEKQAQQVEQIIVQRLQNTFDGLQSRLETAIQKALDTSYEELNREVREVQSVLAEALADIEDLKEEVDVE